MRRSSRRNRKYSGRVAAKELQGAAEPKVFPVPTETEEFRKCLHSTIEGIAEVAANAVRAHIAKHEESGRGGAMTYESWLETGTAFADEDECVFCGQPLVDRRLVHSYAEFFSDAYKTLAEDAKAKRDTFGRYERGEYRSRVEDIVRQNADTLCLLERGGAGSMRQSLKVSRRRSRAWKRLHSC